MNQFDHEPLLPGSRRSPDYVLHHNGNSLLFDLKDFAPHEPTLGSTFVDMYGPIRAKIDKAKEKFRRLRQHCCSLVLYRDQNHDVTLDDYSMYGAMLGDFGVAFPANGSGKPEWGFHGRKGMMYRYQNGQAIAPKNTTISAIIVVEDYHIGMKRYLTSIGKGRPDSDAPIDTSEIIMRARTYQNPYARIPLPDDLPGLLFQSEFDERFGPSEGRLIRKFAGKGWLEIQALEGGSRLSNSAQPVAS